MATSPRPSNPDHFAVRELHLDQVEDLLKLQKAAQKISSILDLDQLIDQIVNDVAHSFGCLEANIYLHDEQRAELILAGVCGCTVYHKGHGLKIGKEGMVGYVAATGQMRYAPDVSKDPYYTACEHATQSEVAIPLLVDGQLVGVFTASHPELDAFPAEQLRLLQSLGSHIAVAVHNARRFKHERDQRETMSREAQEARTIQEALLPKSSPYIPGFAISGVSVPAGAVGGDWFDFIPLSDGRWGLVLADVSGKGTAAALLMSATRGMLRSLATCCGPGEVLARLNRLMVEDFPMGRFVTMVYAVLDPAKRTLTVASAGHLPPLLIDSDGARFLASERGMPLGLGFGDFSELQVSIPQGARVAFYSDGITEAVDPSGEEYGAERLRAPVQLANASAESIVRDVRSFSEGASLRDDATVILVRALD
ncbi:MAG: PP2C family protein-serine/threonine phosphatase [Acidobacteriia bacterium]|nr:PP2C family protein-serine/threonine phosphatase [Terriglobia bacterium]